MSAVSWSSSRRWTSGIVAVVLTAGACVAAGAPANAAGAGPPDEVVPVIVGARAG